MGGQIEMGCKVTGCAYDDASEHMDGCVSRIRRVNARRSKPSM